MFLDLRKINNLVLDFFLKHHCFFVFDFCNNKKNRINNDVVVRLQYDDRLYLRIESNLFFFAKIPMMMIVNEWWWISSHFAFLFVEFIHFLLHHRLSSVKTITIHNGINHDHHVFVFHYIDIFSFFVDHF